MFKKACSKAQRLNTKAWKNTMKARLLKGKFSDQLPEGKKQQVDKTFLSLLKRKLSNRLYTLDSFQLRFQLSIL